MGCVVLLVTNNANSRGTYLVMSAFPTPSRYLSPCVIRLTVEFKSLFRDASKNQCFGVNAFIVAREMPGERRKSTLQKNFLLCMGFADVSLAPRFCSLWEPISSNIRWTMLTSKQPEGGKDSCGLHPWWHIHRPWPPWRTVLLPGRGLWISVYL
jgi:hypothetical protein